MKFFAISILLLLRTNDQAWGDSIKVTLVYYSDWNGQVPGFQEGTLPPEKCQEDGENCVGGLLRFSKELKSIIEYADRWIIRISPGNLAGTVTGWMPIGGRDAWSEFGALFSTPYGIAQGSEQGSFTQKILHVNPCGITPDMMTLGFREISAGAKRIREFLTKARRCNGKLDTTKHLSLVLSNIRFNPCPVREKGVFDDLLDYFCGDFKHLRSDTYQIPYYDRSLDKWTKYPVGVLGFIDPKSMKGHDFGSIQIDEVIGSLKKRISKDFIGVNFTRTFFAIGSGTKELAMEIIDAIPEIKVVILSESADTYTHLEPSEYPIKYGQGLILKDGMFASWLSKVDIEIDSDSGEVDLGVPSRISLSNAYRLAAPGLGLSNGTTTYFDEVGADLPQGIAFTIKELDGGSCSKAECPLGNLLADAVVDCTTSLTLKRGDQSLIRDLISVWPSQGISPIKLSQNSYINMTHLYQLIPQMDPPILVKLTGDSILKLFQWSAQSLDGPDLNFGQFLQVSRRLKVKYAKDPESGKHRVKEIRLISEGLPGTIIDPNRTYPVVLPLSIFRGSWGFSLFQEEEYKNLPFQSLDVPKLVSVRVDSCITHCDYVEPNGGPAFEDPRDKLSGLKKIWATTPKEGLLNCFANYLEKLAVIDLHDMDTGKMWRIQIGGSDDEERTSLSSAGKWTIVTLGVVLTGGITILLSKWIVGRLKSRSTGTTIQFNRLSEELN